MGELTAAIERLTAAVGRLERAAARRVPAIGEERLDLTRKLDEARAELSRVSNVTGVVAERLDSAIARVRTALEGQGP